MSGNLSIVSAVTQFVNATQATWNSVTIPVPTGVVVYASDTTVVKMGDGQTLYANLPSLFTLNQITNLSNSLATNTAAISAINTTLAGIEGGALTTAAMTSGTINGVTIGGSTPAPGTFTMLNNWSIQFGLADSSNTTPVNGGINYAVGDILTLNDGGSPHATIVVQTISGGAITAYAISSRGVLPRAPASSPITVASTTGSGTGATFNLTYAPLVSGMMFSSANTNLFVGSNTPNSAFSGTESVFIGGSAGGNIVSGNFNVCVGLNAGGVGAGVPLTNVASMVCVGTDAGRNLAQGASTGVLIGNGVAENYAGTKTVVIGGGLNYTSGSQNVLLLGGNTITSGAGNFVGGYNADVTSGTVQNAVVVGGTASGGGNGARGGSNSVIIGAGAGNGNLTGASNFLIGMTIGSAMTTATFNVGMGRQVLNALVNGQFNTGIGDSALFNNASTTNTNPNGNTAVGAAAGFGASGATFNTCTLLGVRAGGGLSTGSTNTLVGANTGVLLTTGGANTIIGANVATTTLITGTNNILVGTSSSVDTTLTSTSNTINIGNIWTATGTNTPATAVSSISGSLTIGTLLKLNGYTVSTLPTASSAGVGAMAYVTDATAPTYNGALTGGGTVVVPVFSNGTTWTAH